MSILTNRSNSCLRLGSFTIIFAAASVVVGCATERPMKRVIPPQANVEFGLTASGELEDPKINDESLEEVPIDVLIAGDNTIHALGNLDMVRVEDEWCFYRGPKRFAVGAFGFNRFQCWEASTDGISVSFNVNPSGDVKRLQVNNREKDRSRKRNGVLDRQLKGQASLGIIFVESSPGRWCISPTGRRYWCN